MLKAPVPSEHLRAIGQVTVNFALLESALSTFVWELISAEQRLGQTITAELSFRNLVALASSLSRFRNLTGETLERCEALLNRALEAEGHRNAVAHSLWAAGHTPASVTRIKVTAKKSKGLNHQFVQMTVDDLQKVADLIAE